MYKKKKIIDIEAVYTVNAFRNESGFYIAAGSETKPEVTLYDMSTGEKNAIPHLPGGMMSFIPMPGKPDLFISIMELFPPFVGKDAGIYLHTRMDTNWESGKALALPFAHRCETLSFRGKHFLVAATVSKHKDDPGDWSRPGELHVIDLEMCEIRKWKSTVINSSITKNHGMFKTRDNDTESIYVCGEQGIFQLDKIGDDWVVDQLFYGEVSELTLIDIDGDGTDELVTIEPFHGNTLNIYKRDGANWVHRFRDTLSFGHGLSSGIFHSEPTIVVGNRSESLALEAFVVKNLLRGEVDRRVIEEAAGPTQTQVFTYDSKDYIVSANQKKNEVALYT